jgi:quercetin dioxygenase-like cupin family protein
MIKAYRVFTGSDGNSHLVSGSISGGELVQAESILFKETPAHSSFDWHNDPIPQYVITLSGVLEFTTVGGETFTIHPRDVLLAVDHTGTGHKWRLVNDEPWKRAYVVFKEGADTRLPLLCARSADRGPGAPWRGGVYATASRAVL